MTPKLQKILSLLLVCAICASLFTGCVLITPSLAETNGPSAATQPSSAATVPATDPADGIEEPTTLPPSASVTIQQAVSQKPCRPQVAIPKLSAKNYFIFDTRLDDFLYVSCDTDKLLYPASITKLFTTYVALQYLDADAIITVGSELSYVAYDASVAGFKKGDRVSVEALVYGALLPSGCDASYILAAAAGKTILGDKNASAKKAIDAFMAACNRLAKELGMEKTNFVTPDGYHDAAHKVSVQAFVIIGKCSLENKVIRKIVAKSSATITYKNSVGNACTKTFTNTNYCIQSDSKYYDSACVGLKTGFTDAAGYCLLTAYKVAGRYILVGIFGCANSKDRFSDANKLIDAYLPYL